MPANKVISTVPLLLLAAVVGAAVPKPLDPLMVAPHIYALDFENEKVRVIRQTVRNGETLPLHAHPDRVMVYLQSCAWLEDDGAGGEHMQLFKIGVLPAVFHIAPPPAAKSPAALLMNLELVTVGLESLL